MVYITLLLLLAVMACGETDESSAASEQTAHEVQEGVPTLIDLGSLSCVPCQMMEGELVALDRLSGERLTVTFIDVYQNPDAASQHGIRIIPTQIFLAPDGTELYRHEGYMSADQMLARWIGLGYDVYDSGEDPDAS